MDDKPGSMHTVSVKMMKCSTKNGKIMHKNSGRLKIFFLNSVYFFIFI